MKDKIASGNSTTGKSNLKVGPKPDSKDGKAKTASQKNSAAKKITDKAALKYNNSAYKGLGNANPTTDIPIHNLFYR